jgi:sulfate permease, SulP family
VGSSLLLAIRHFAQPLVTELGKLPNTRDYVDCERHPEAIQAPGLLVVRPEEPLFFANAEQIFQAIQRRIDTRQPRAVVLSLEACNALDITAVEALIEFLSALRQQGIAVALARVKDGVREAMASAGLNPANGSGLSIYWSVDDAVEAL